MLLAMDGMGHYVTADIEKKWSTKYLDAYGYSVITVEAEGRFGNCLRKTFNNGAPFSTAYVEMAPRVTRTGVWTPNASGVVGFALKVDDVGNLVGRTGNGSQLWTMCMVSVVEGTWLHFGLAIESNGTIALLVNGPGTGVTYAATTGECIQDGVWSYLEMKWTVHPTAGSVVVKVDGLEMMNYTGRTQTSYSGHTTLGVWNGVRVLEEVGTRNSAQNYRLCDFYLADQVATDAQDVADFLGDGIIDKIRPDGVGDTVQWTPSTGANWQNVDDELQHDSDTTYNSTDTPGDIDIHTYEDIPVDSVVLAAQWVGLFRKEEEGKSSITPQCKIGSTTYEYVEQGVPDVTYSRYLLQPLDISPATGTDWTPAEINGAQFGVEKTS